ncbi:glutamate N-acetyltransferase [Sarracenia purpurea var. burkii]
MGIRLPAVFHAAKQVLRSKSLHTQSSTSSSSSTQGAAKADVPKGHFAVYVGENRKNRFVVPLGYLKQPLFQDLLRRAEEEYGFDYPTGGLTIPCSEGAFFSVASHLKHP